MAKTEANANTTDRKRFSSKTFVTSEVVGFTMQCLLDPPDWFKIHNHLWTADLSIYLHAYFIFVYLFVLEYVIYQMHVL